MIKIFFFKINVAPLSLSCNNPQMVFPIEKTEYSFAFPLITYAFYPFGYLEKVNDKT